MSKFDKVRPYLQERSKPTPRKVNEVTLLTRRFEGKDKRIKTEEMRAALDKCDREYVMWSKSHPEYDKLIGYDLTYEDEFYLEGFYDLQERWQGEFFADDPTVEQLQEYAKLSGNFPRLFWLAEHYKGIDLSEEE